MPVKDTTYRLRGLLILFVFGFSLLPRQVLHNFVTNHKHVKWAGHQGKTQISAETFNCSAGSVFTQQTFDSTDHSFTVALFPARIVKFKTVVCFRENDNYYQISLRGPPALS